MLAARIVCASEGFELARVSCDGVDPARPRAERTDGDRVVLVLRGTFELRGGRGWHVLDPSRALVLRDAGETVFRHPHGGDVCLSLRGALATRLADAGPPLRPISAEHWRELAALAHRPPPRDLLGVEELLSCALGPTAPAPRRPAREAALAEAIAEALRRAPEERLTLRALAAALGYSEFHLCRVFRRITGQTIQAYRREIRLRHALALLLDGDRPIAEIAATTGFTDQAHLTNHFRARFGVTPARTRRHSRWIR